MYNHRRAPIYEALLNIKKNHISFHVPGHKLGQDYDPEGLLIFQSLLTIDQTELEGLDDLHHAESIIAEAEELASDAFGSEETKFLVGGTTSGILALLIAHLGQGDRCLIERTSHKSIYNGIKMVGGKAVLLTPNIEKESGIPIGVSPEQVEQELNRNQDIKAVFLTNPNYYGQTSDLKSIAEIVHHHGLLLFIDEAHGAHFKFHNQLPLTALEQGADGVVQSTHKTLPAMTMGSMLHFQGDRINRIRVKQALSMIQSSSPSYPIMASLDLARRYMMIGEGKQKLSSIIQEIQLLKQELIDISWIKSIPTDDPLRLVLSLPEGWSRILQQHLQNNGIYVEIVEPERMVFVFTGGNTAMDIIHLLKVLKAFSLPSESYHFKQYLDLYDQFWSSRSDVALDLQMDGMDREWIALELSENRIVAEMIIPYPPGIPLLLQGERLTQEMITIIANLLKEHVHIHGIRNSQIQVYTINDEGGR